MFEEKLWAEKYRPLKVSECILPQKLKALFQKFADEKEINNLLLSGSSGIGKTTVALALCEEVGCSYMFLSGSKETGVDTVRTKIAEFASSMSLKSGRKVIIIDEADYLSTNAQAALRSSMDEFSKTCTFIFTCNFVNRIMKPLRSRFSEIEFSIPEDELVGISVQFYKRVKSILQDEGVTFDDKLLAQIVKKYFPDFRKCLTELHSYCGISKVLDVGILATLGKSDIALKLVDLMRAQEYGKCRQFIGSSDIDYTTIFTDLYDCLWEHLLPQTIPIAIEALGEYSFRSAFVPDQEINLMALVTAIMKSCTFK